MNTFSLLLAALSTLGRPLFAKRCAKQQAKKLDQDRMARAEEKRQRRAARNKELAARSQS